MKALINGYSGIMNDYGSSQINKCKIIFL